MELNKLSKYKLTSISTTETNIQADTTGGSATHWGAWTFNGDKSIKYEQIQDDVNITVDNNDGKGFVQFLGNAASGFAVGIRTLDITQMVMVDIGLQISVGHLH